VIKVTEEMQLAFIEAKQASKWGPNTAYVDGIAAVLAIVERDLGLIGPCSAVLPHLFDEEIGTLCELRHGHSGDHESGPIRWKERSPS
jgi:hypothetical protein